MNRTIGIGLGVALSLLVGGGIGHWLGTRGMGAQGMTEAPPNPMATSSGTTPAGATAERKVLYWHDPMVPGHKFDKPGKSPFMNMQLVPMYADEGGGSGVSVSPAMTSSLGIRTAVVRKSALTASVDAIGTVAENERASAVVQARVAGYIEKLHARANFDAVAAGAPIALIHAPEWAGAQAEYLALRRARTDPALIDAARQRLRLLSIPDAVVASAERNDVPETRYTLTAPRGGVVADLAVREGAMVTPGMTVMRIVSLADVWVYAEIPEAAAGTVAVGAAAEVRLPAVPEQVLRGRVSAMLPQVNATSRTLRARIELPNREGRLIPGMLVNVMLTAPRQEEVIVVPQEAVIATGKRSVVVVRDDNGRFSPVDVVTGRAVGGDIEVRQGLREGQTVVVSGQFLLDSESSLKASLPTPEASAVMPMAPGGYRGTAKVEKIAKDEITLSHGPIPALQWPSMTMGFKPPAAGLPGDVKVGDAVEFSFDKTVEGNYALTRITPTRPAAARP